MSMNPRATKKTALGRLSSTFTRPRTNSTRATEPLRSASLPASLPERWNSARASLDHHSTKIQTGDLSSEDVIIAVMGPTGSGKSSFINKATRLDDAMVGHDLESCTTEIGIVKVRCVERSELDVVFVDTPGFDDTNKSDVEILEMIANWLKTTYKRKIMLTGILYFHRISDNRMAGSPLKNLHMFEKLCGRGALRNIILTTTMWDDVDQDVGDLREKELLNHYWSSMIGQGSRTLRYLNTEQSAWDIVDVLVRDANQRCAVELQQELVELHKQLPETKAGQELYSKLELLVQRQQQSLQGIRDAMKHGIDDTILVALKSEHEELRHQLRSTITEMQNLKIPIGKRLTRSFSLPLGFFSKRFR